MAAQLVLSKEMIDFFFIKGPQFIEKEKTRNTYTCNCEVVVGRMCTSKKNAFTLIRGSGFSNLKKHLETCVPNFETIYSNRKIVNRQDIRSFVTVDRKTQTIHK